MSLSTILAALSAVPSLWSLIDSSVQSVETALVGATGSTKLAAATAKVNSVLGTVTTDIGDVSALGGILTPLINASVAMFNASGLFTKATAAAPAPTATA